MVESLQAIPATLNILAWQPASPNEIRQYLEQILERSEKNQKEKDTGSQPQRRRGPKDRPLILAVRTHLVQLDIFCYLKARFGEPNGFQNFLRKDDSDNLIHWEYHLICDGVHIQIMGVNRETHFLVREFFTDEHWRDLILRIKDDYRRVGPEKSRALRQLEKWVVFPNKYVHISSVCAELYDEITSNISGFEEFKPKSAEFNSKRQKQLRVADKLSRRAHKLYGSCVQLSLLTPILAESFLNMLILILCKPEIRNNRAELDKFIRAHIHTRIFSLSDKCLGFSRPVNEETPGFGRFKRIMDRRNHVIHGNVDPVREQLETVYFQGTRPIFTQTGDHLGQFYSAMERQHEPARVLSDYEDTHSFLVEIVGCLEPRLRTGIWAVIEDRYPGYDANRQRAGSLFPDYVATSYFPGIKYDDELAVDWPSRFR